MKSEHKRVIRWTVHFGRCPCVGHVTLSLIDCQVGRCLSIRDALSLIQCFHRPRAPRTALLFSYRINITRQPVAWSRLCFQTVSGTGRSAFPPRSDECSNARRKPAAASRLAVFGGRSACRVIRRFIRLLRSPLVDSQRRLWIRSLRRSCDRPRVYS